MSDKKYTPAQKLKRNIIHYMNGQSAMPHFIMFKEGYFNFVNGEVVATDKATKLYNKAKKPWDKTIKIEGLKLDPNARSGAMLEVIVGHKGKQTILTFGGGLPYSWRYDNDGADPLYQIILSNYSVFADKVLAYANGKNYHTNLKKAKCIQGYIEEFKDDRFTWVKWLLNELGVQKYTFRDKHLYKCPPKAEEKCLETYRKVLDIADYCLMLPSTILYKHFNSNLQFKTATMDEDCKHFSLDNYMFPNPGVNQYMPKDLYKFKTIDDDYDDDESTLDSPIVMLMEHNLVTVINGVVTINPESDKYTTEWENKFKEIIRGNIVNWRLTNYNFQYKSSTDEDDNDRSANEYSVHWQIPAIRFSSLYVNGGGAENIDGDVGIVNTHILELASKLGVKDELDQGLATVTHPRMMMDILTQCLTKHEPIKDKLTGAKSDVRSTIAGVLNHLDKHMVV